MTGPLDPRPPALPWPHPPPGRLSRRGPRPPGCGLPTPGADVSPSFDPPPASAPLPSSGLRWVADRPDGASPRPIHALASHLLSQRGARSLLSSGLSLPSSPPSLADRSLSDPPSTRSPGPQRSPTPTHFFPCDQEALLTLPLSTTCGLLGLREWPHHPAPDPSPPCAFAVHSSEDRCRPGGARRGFSALGVSLCPVCCWDTRLARCFLFSLEGVAWDFHVPDPPTSPSGCCQPWQGS